MTDRLAMLPIAKPVMGQPEADAARPRHSVGLDHSRARKSQHSKRILQPSRAPLTRVPSRTAQQRFTSPCLRSAWVPATK